MQELKLADDLFPRVVDGSKRGTIRLGKRDIEPGELLLTGSSAGLSHLVDVDRVTYTKASRLRESDAEMDGYSSLTELWADLRRFYPSVAGSDLVTVIVFR